MIFATFISLFGSGKWRVRPKSGLAAWSPPGGHRQTRGMPALLLRAYARSPQISHSTATTSQMSEQPRPNVFINSVLKRGALVAETVDATAQRQKRRHTKSRQGCVACKLRKIKVHDFLQTFLVTCPELTQVSAMSANPALAVSSAALNANRRPTKTVLPVKRRSASALR